MVYVAVSAIIIAILASKVQNSSGLWVFQRALIKTLPAINNTYFIGFTFALTFFILHFSADKAIAMKAYNRPSHMGHREILLVTLMANLIL